MPGMRTKRKRVKRFRKYRIHILCLSVLVVAVTAAFWPAHLWNSQLDTEIEGLTRQRNAQEQETLALQEQIRRLNTPDYIEQLARQDLGLVKPGEVPITPVTPGKR